MGNVDEVNLPKVGGAYVLLANFVFPHTYCSFIRQSATKYNHLLLSHTIAFR
eukprot:SAG31_NODE_2043_length_6582_cov_2.798952_2_plen_52_part_00